MKKPKTAPGVLADLLSDSDLARQLGCSTQTLRRFRARGMPCVRVGKLVMFEPEKVRAWIFAQQPASPSSK